MTKKTALTQGRLKDLLDYDADSGVLLWKVKRQRVKVGAPAGSVQSGGYIQIMIDGVRHLAHRLVWMYHYGEWPKDLLDHINRDKRDNRIENLRDATQSLNSLNRKTFASSGYKGVTRLTSGRFRASIGIFGKVVYLGQFDTPEEAHDVFKQVHRDLYWERSEYWGEAA